MEENKNKNKNQSDEKQEFEKLTVMGDTYFTKYTRKYRNRQAWTKPNDKEIVSFIPGTIRKVLVRVGDEVEINDKLLVLEAMKMMNSINTPVAGKIKSILVNIGDCIPKGTLMIEIE
jgi:biotin carboxyl carrier protein